MTDSIIIGTRIAGAIREKLLARTSPTALVDATVTVLEGREPELATVAEWQVTDAPGGKTYVARLRVSPHEQTTFKDVDMHCGDMYARLRFNDALCKRSGFTIMTHWSTATDVNYWSVFLVLDE